MPHFTVLMSQRHFISFIDKVQKQWYKFTAKINEGRTMAKSKKDKEKEEKILEHKRQVEEEAVKKDLEERYPNYRQDWDYDPYRHFGHHKPTGFEVVDTFYEKRVIQCNNLHQFYGKMRAQGMNTEQIEAYRRDLCNQFYFINEAEAIWTPKPRTFEEELADEENTYQWHLRMAEKYGRTEEEKEGIHKRHENEIKEIYKKFGKER